MNVVGLKIQVNNARKAEDYLYDQLVIDGSLLEVPCLDDRVLECKFFDSIDMVAYFHFDEPVTNSDLQGYFEEEKLIYELVD